MSEQENRANGNTSQEQNPGAGTGLMIPQHTPIRPCVVRPSAQQQTSKHTTAGHLRICPPWEDKARDQPKKPKAQPKQPGPAPLR
ncbi:hypothetical protein TrVFT333_002000 [Trichoderma virens FT-333]|nr:hypothetical protein TrVFT333_002000 [Trichoderma virens FT-333]